MSLLALTPRNQTTHCWPSFMPGWMQCRASLIIRRLTPITLQGPCSACVGCCLQPPRPLHGHRFGRPHSARVEHRACQAPAHTRWCCPPH